ncbi:hypothetical protein [Yinghuangia sp. YIM S09857]|uniref:hypothetical protein n=1 Tax=Yinghuangia sp. YIM S09857 TaxID=3436929 RepID=UPI003F535254
MHPTAPGPTRRTQPAADPRIDLLLIHAIHDALRRDVRRLVAWSRTGFPVTTPAWLDFRRRLTDYLVAEADVLRPYAAGEPPGEREDARAAAETKRRLRRLVLLVETVDECLSGRGPAGRTAEYMPVLDAALTDYLDHVHATLLPVLADRITPRDWADFDVALRQPLGLTSGVALYAWLTDGTPPERRAAIHRLLPPAVRIAYRWLATWPLSRSRARRRE